MVVDLEVDVLGFALMTNVDNLEGRLGIHAGHGHRRMPARDHDLDPPVDRVCQGLDRLFRA